mmetsp:Transcript_30413/g.77825  ORF Transcript_30413/g.77825 Transcript_30413/m.77825 type:complete len:415 (+) Transcript_30413:118-1362(+)
MAGDGSPSFCRRIHHHVHRHCLMVLECDEDEGLGEVVASVLVALPHAGVRLHRGRVHAVGALCILAHQHRSHQHRAQRPRVARHVHVAGVLVRVRSRSREVASFSECADLGACPVESLVADIRQLARRLRPMPQQTHLKLVGAVGTVRGIFAGQARKHGLPRGREALQQGPALDTESADELRLGRMASLGPEGTEGRPLGSTSASLADDAPRRCAAARRRHARGREAEAAAQGVGGAREVVGGPPPQELRPPGLAQRQVRTQPIGLPRRRCTGGRRLRGTGEVGGLGGLEEAPGVVGLHPRLPQLQALLLEPLQACSLVLGARPAAYLPRHPRARVDLQRRGLLEARRRLEVHAVVHAAQLEFDARAVPTVRLLNEGGVRPSVGGPITIHIALPESRLPRGRGQAGSSGRHPPV